jgi:TatD DNase family protein
MKNVEFIDSHCHLYLPHFKGDRDVVVQRAISANVTKMLVVGVDLESFPAMFSLVNKYDFMYATVGVHPSYRLKKMLSVADFVAYYGRLIQENPNKVVAIGEMGLDYFRDYDKDYQHILFKNQILAALELKLPVIIHTRNAREDTLDLLKECHAEKVGGVIHCFSEDWEFAQEVLDLNFMLSFSGVVTMQGHTDTLEAVARVPNDRYLIETDSPYLTPHPKNNRKRNEPAYVCEMAAKVAEIKGITIEQVARDSTKNFNTLFKV